MHKALSILRAFANISTRPTGQACYKCFSTNASRTLTPTDIPTRKHQRSGQYTVYLRIDPKSSDWIRGKKSSVSLAHDRYPLNFSIRKAAYDSFERKIRSLAASTPQFDLVLSGQPELEPNGSLLRCALSSEELERIRKELLEVLASQAVPKEKYHKSQPLFDLEAFRAARLKRYEDYAYKPVMALPREGNAEEGGHRLAREVRGDPTSLAVIGISLEEQLNRSEFEAGKLPKRYCEYAFQPQA